MLIRTPLAHQGEIRQFFHTNTLIRTPLAHQGKSFHERKKILFELLFHHLQEEMDFFF